MQVRARPAPRLFGGATQELGEHVVALGEVAVGRMALVGMAALAGVVAIVARVRRRLLRPRGVNLAGVEPPAFLWVREQIVGDAYLFEPLLGLLVAGIEVRVQLLGQLSVSRANLVGRSGLGDAKNSHMGLAWADPAVRVRPTNTSRIASIASRRAR